MSSQVIVIHTIIWQWMFLVQPPTFDNICDPGRWVRKQKKNRKIYCIGSANY